MRGGFVLGENRKNNRQIKFRVNDQEFEKLKQTAETLEMTVPTFAKKRAMDFELKPPKTKKADMVLVTKELRAIGNNVNQIAKRLNATNKLSIEQLDGIRKELNLIWQQLI